MKKLHLIILFMTVTNSFVFSQSNNWMNHRNTQWATDYEKGKSFVVNTPEDLAQLAWLVNVEGKTFQDKTISLQPQSGKSLDLSSYWWTPIGTNSNRFSGSLDGKENSITGLKINMPETECIGFVGVLGSEGKILNLHLTIGKEGITGGNRAAGMVASSHGTIQNCSVEGSLIIAKGYSVGGIVASAYPGSKILNCSATIPVEASDVLKLHAGGLVGYLDDGTISGCKASGSVTLRNSDTSDAGGLIGYLKSGTVEDSHANGTIVVESSVGALSGQLVGRDRQPHE